MRSKKRTQLGIRVRTAVSLRQYHLVANIANKYCHHMLHLIILDDGNTADNTKPMPKNKSLSKKLLLPFDQRLHCFVIAIACSDNLLLLPYDCYYPCNDLMVSEYCKILYMDQHHCIVVFRGFAATETIKMPNEAKEQHTLRCIDALVSYWKLVAGKRFH